MDYFNNFVNDLCKNNLIILDCCHAAALVRGKVGIFFFLLNIIITSVKISVIN